jgi:hypothetical protein
MWKNNVNTSGFKKYEIISSVDIQSSEVPEPKEKHAPSSEVPPPKEKDLLLKRDEYTIDLEEPRPTLLKWTM